MDGIASSGCLGSAAARVLASASARSRTFVVCTLTALAIARNKSLFRRDAETSTRAACAPQKFANQRLGFRFEEIR